ncbi:MAG: thermonuclease family protein, partial [Candidatus Omnitrophica bacterium]|nr:thermonuclease family protein [Candidatus Omnitrophota bacterium]
MLSFLRVTKNLISNKQQILDKVKLPQKATVTRIIDGDTIGIDNGMRIRYIGINAPETRHPPKAVEYFGREASSFNKKLVFGKEIFLEYDIQKFDKYGRVLAYVYINDIFVNAKLVEEGYAQVFTV